MPGGANPHNGLSFNGGSHDACLLDKGRRWIGLSITSWEEAQTSLGPSEKKRRERGADETKT